MQETSNGTCFGQLLQIDPDLFKRDFNRKPLRFQHHLANEPLLQMEALAELASRLARIPGEVYFDTGVNRIEQRWDQTPKPTCTLEELVTRLEEASAWIILRRAELDPRYRAILDRCMGELKDLDSSDWWPWVSVQNAIVFITSPRRISTYHIDRECNFILQIRGRKDIYVFDQNDREVLPEDELERFWSVDNNAARYRPQYQSRATLFHLLPGEGVHIPVNAPHWVENGDSASITLSINFQFRDTYRANKYRANYFIRRLGLTPTPPGSSALRDAMKAETVRVLWTLGKPFKKFLLARRGHP
jgi:hypothetical protein